MNNGYLRRGMIRLVTRCEYKFVLAGIALAACYFLPLNPALADAGYDGSKVGRELGERMVVNQDPPAQSPLTAQKADPKTDKSEKASNDEPPKEGAATKAEPEQPAADKFRAQAVPLNAQQQGQSPAGKPAIPVKPGDKALDLKAQEGEGGCGSKPGDATAPTPNTEGPQPLFVCKEPKVDIGEIWRGADAEFTFTVANEGEGELHIRLKGG